MKTMILTTAALSALALTACSSSQAPTPIGYNVSDLSGLNPGYDGSTLAVQPVYAGDPTQNTSTIVRPTQAIPVENSYPTTGAQVGVPTGTVVVPTGSYSGPNDGSTPYYGQ